MAMNCTSKYFVSTQCTDSLAVLRFKLPFVAQIFQTRDLDCVLTSGTTTTSQGTHAMLLSAVDAPFVDSIFGLCVDAVYCDAGDDATNFVERNPS
jgi:hypothetical protein